MNLRNDLREALINWAWGHNIPTEVQRLADDILDDPTICCALDALRADAWDEGLNASFVDANATNPWRVR